mmetsp:Transcript_16146/g.35091  ORF Transcript_16146/g.35091 Transcript_16146/m.35091 type:complete len:234 (-) Transcript_16146:414-1115(-)
MLVSLSPLLLDSAVGYGVGGGVRVVFESSSSTSSSSGCSSVGFAVGGSDLISTSLTVVGLIIVGSAVGSDWLFTGTSPEIDTGAICSGVGSGDGTAMNTLSAMLSSSPPSLASAGFAPFFGTATYTPTATHTKPSRTNRQSRILFLVTTAFASSDGLLRYIGRMLLLLSSCSRSLRTGLPLVMDATASPPSPSPETVLPSANMLGVDHSVPGSPLDRYLLLGGVTAAAAATSR